MADRTTPKIYERRPTAGRDVFEIANGVRLAPGTLVGIEGGYANHWADGANDVFAGIAIAGETSGNAATDDPSTWLGDTSGAPDPNPSVTVDTSGVTLMHLAGVAGASAITNQGDLVYCADSDPENIQVSSSGMTHPIGWIVRWRSATDVDVRLFTPSEMLCQATA